MEKVGKQDSHAAAPPLGGATEPGAAPGGGEAAMGVQGGLPLVVVLLVCVVLGKPGELRRCIHLDWGGWGARRSTEAYLLAPPRIT